MTTSDPEETKATPQQSIAQGSVNPLPIDYGAFPDPSVMAEIANQIFRGLPEQTPPSKALSTLTSNLSAADKLPINQMRKEPNFTPEAKWKDVSAYLAATAASAPGTLSALIPDLSALVPESTASSMPLPSAYPGIPDFSFLADIRPLVSGATELAGKAMSAAALTGSLKPAAELPGMAMLDPSAYGMPNLANDIESLAALATPQIPGTVAQTMPASAVLDLQEQIRSLSDYAVIPVLEALGSKSPGLTPLYSAPAQLNLETIRRDFPILQERINGRRLIWLDNAATTQKPQSVIDRISYFYEHENSNIHRAAHELAARATDAYEAARESVRRFLNAASVGEIVFVRGATEAINLVAQSWGRQNIGKDDEIVISWLEHHANIVPWQMLCAEKGARLRVAPVDEHGQIILSEYERLLGPKTKLVAFTQVSNALGTVTPFGEMIQSAHRHGAKVLLDGAQAVSHMHVDMQEYDCDFYVFSGHKVFAPTGIGVLYGKSQLLDKMQPWQGGGNMIHDVTFERTIYQKAPLRFEAGTGSIADAVGLGAAIDYLDRLGMINVSRHENEVMAYAGEALKSVPGLRPIGTAANKASVLSFVLDGFKTEEISEALNKQGIAVRAGHHCAQPILRRFGVESTVRPSLALYNTCEDIDVLIAALWNIKQGRKIGPL